MFILILLADTSCSSCLKENNNLDKYTKLWCISTETCMDVADIKNCQNYEMHDMLYDANVCCVDVTKEDTCLGASTISYCLWCPKHSETLGACMYSGPQGPDSNYDNVNNNCLTSPDISSQCSTLDTCPKCAENVVCAFCPQQGRCITKIVKEKPYPKPEYKCLDGMTTICCDSYSDCETCGLNTMSIVNPVCAWCSNGNASRCDTSDKIFSNCSGDINALGAGYCADTCYLRGKNCDSCLALSGCIWMGEGRLTGSDDSKNFQLCVQGGSSGPKSNSIIFVTQLPTQYTFEVISFNYLTCALKSTQLNALIISLVVLVVLALVIAYVATFIVKKVRYNKLLKMALLAALTDEDKKMVEEEQAFDVNDYMATVQAIPWEDEVQ